MAATKSFLVDAVLELRFDEALQQALRDVKAVLAANISGVTFYDYWIPLAGAKFPAISMIVVAADGREVGIGQVLDASKKGLHVDVLVQVDVWAYSPGIVKRLADRVAFYLWKNRGSFGNFQRDIRLMGSVWIPGEAEKEDQPIYRVTQTYATTYTMIS